jgi:exodeoxyribonuclease V alpha subunit
MAGNGGIFPDSAEPASWLEGRLGRVVWAAEDGGYAVVRIKTPTGDVTAVGALALLADEAEEDDFLALEGRWEEHPVHGRQFRSTGFLQGLPRTLDGLTLYLAQAGIPGVGKAIAERIVSHLGVSALQVLSDSPEKLAEIPGLGPKKIQAIVERWRADAEGTALAVRLRALGLSPRTVQRIRESYGDRAAVVVAREPYRLAEDIPGVGFRTADALARDQGVAPDDPARVRAAALYALERAESEGHCFLPREVLARVVGDLGVPVDDLDAAIDGAALDRRLRVEPAESDDDDPLRLPLPHPADRLFSPTLHRAEVEVAERLVHLIQGEGPAIFDPESAVDRASRYEGVTLGADQRAAVVRALESRVSIITGGPGTGKTTLVRVLLRVLHEAGIEVALASPTGRAARRLEEASGRSASTLHRLLEYKPGEGGFQRSVSAPLDGDGVIVDEVSMVDLPLFVALLRAIPGDQPFLLVLVGDADQLPSVGPGQILRDLIGAGVVPVARLTRVYRQGQDSGILVAAGDILGGRVPQSGDRAGFDDCYLLERVEPERALETVLQVVCERLPKLKFDPMEAVQVLAPTRKGPLGTESLNRELQVRLNPHGQEIKRGGKGFRVGDRVLCTRNRYDVEVFNGDVGRVVDAGPSGLGIVFDGRRVDWAWDELPSLDLAYAMTVHKSQGSEYPAVVLCLHPSHSIMLRRNLFYTAVTRARRFLVVVGTVRAWTRAVGEAGGDERFTLLSERLASAIGET